MPRHYKPRRRRSAGLTLCQFLISRGGSATALQISHHTASGGLLKAAEPENGGRWVIETIRGRNNRPARRVSLTLAGWECAAALDPEWTPRRLALPVLKQWLADLQAEQDVWATQFVRDAADARKWREHQQAIKDKKIRCRPRWKRRMPEQVKADAVKTTAMPTKPANALIPQSQPTPKPDCIICESDRLLGVKTDHDCNQFRAVSVTPDVPKPEVTTPSAPQAEQPSCRRWGCKFCERCHLNTDICGCGPLHVCGTLKIDLSIFPQPTWKPEQPKQPPPPDPLAEKIREAGYTVKNGKVQYGDGWIDPAEWRERMPHVKL